MSQHILCITEKKDQAQALAKAMNWRKGNACFEGSFENKKTIVVWARGHLLSLKEPDEIVENLGWNNPKALSPIPNIFQSKIANNIPKAPAAAQPKNYVKNIRAQIKNASEVIIATDSDREGESIGWELIEFFKFKGSVRRAWFAAGLDVKSIKQAMSSLKQPYETKSWFRASQARGRSDWAYMFLVRAYTYYAQRSVFGGNLGAGRGAEAVMSVGRVQTAALGMIHKRELEIENFVAIEHYKIFADFNKQNDVINAEYTPNITQEIIDSKPKGIRWEETFEESSLDKPYFTDKAIVAKFKNDLLHSGHHAVVKDYKERSKKENAPKTFSLTGAQAKIGGIIKKSAAIVQTILEDLYEQGYLSYARTSKSEIPMNFYDQGEREGMLNTVSELSEVNAQAKKAIAIHNNNDQQYKQFIPASFSKKEMEHHGIVPTHQKMSQSSFNSLSPRKGKGYSSYDMQKTYLIVVKQFIRIFYPAAEYGVQDIAFSVPVKDILGNDESIFKAKGQRIIDLGWRSAFNEKPKDDNVYPKLSVGEVVNLKEITLKNSVTKPPSRYNAITFPKAMETVGKDVRDKKLRSLLKNSEGIGTPATRSTVIKTLLVRKYIESIDKDEKYKLTMKGKDLINNVPEWLSDACTTAKWEDALIRLCDVKDDADAVEKRDKFVTWQINKLNNLIDHLNNQFYAENLKSNYTGNSGSRNKPPSSKQLAFAKNIIKSLPKTYSVPSDVFLNVKSCSEFIDAALKYQKENKDLIKNPPSPKQKKFAKTLFDKLSKTEQGKWGKDILTDRRICSTFINECLNKK